jgi:hypothetical protein
MHMRKINMANIMKTNKIAIICKDCDPLFKNLFSNIDIITELNDNKTNEYDIIINVNSFDVFCGRLSLLANNGFSERNLCAMNKTISRLYKLHKEMTDMNISEIYDGTNKISLNSLSNNGLKVNNIENYI